MKNIRNFSIIAHIDHGKSTISDRLIESCQGIDAREMQDRILDGMDLEKERGITIKAQSVTLNYTAQNGQTYQLNFIDTPGHVDFAYEVSRSLSACEGALLVVDCAQGVEAQTVAVCYAAFENDLQILPVLNKIDLPQADPERIKNEVEEIIGIDTEHSIAVSGKTGQGIDHLLEALVHQIPPPIGDIDAPLQALIIDSWFDNYLGVVSLIRIVNGQIKLKSQIKILSTDVKYEVLKIGFFTPKRVDQDTLIAGQVGFLVAGIKDVSGAPVGDTITTAKNGCEQVLPGFQKSKPQVYAGLFPQSADDYEAFRDALTKLNLNDAALFYEPENSDALGHGFRCGFLGLLHMEIVQERLEREYDLSLITTAPSVIFAVVTKDGKRVEIGNPSQLPDINLIDEIHEPIADVNILTPDEYLGNIMTLCIERRGIQKDVQYHGKQVALHYEIPMSEIVLDFFDRVKSLSRGYASLDYHFKEFRQATLVRLDIMINGEKVDALATIIHKDRAYSLGRLLAKKLKELIPKQMFAVAIQAAIGSNIIARETVSAMRKDVTAKCYGGDISRKKKLLEKQKAGKKRMKQVGRVHIPQNAFLAVLKVNDK